MRRFRVRVNGRNFLIARPRMGRLAKHGFYSNRIVEAVNEREAERLAVEQIREMKSLREMVRNSKEDLPRIHVEGINEVRAFEGLGSTDQGLAWYCEGT